MTDTEIDTPRTRMEAVLPPRQNLLPRSVIRNNTFVLLDGEWRFDLDREDRGLRERWYLKHSYTGTAHWPGSIENQIKEAQTVPSEGLPWKDEVIAWYERDFEVPEEWLTDLSEIQVTFGACGYETRVWLNGRALHTVEDEEVHQGEYTSFSYELPREHLLPVNRLTVRVADTLDPDRPRGKQESQVFKRGGIWYQTLSGPVRSIWIEPIERNRLRTRLSVSSTIEERLVEFRVTTRVHDPGVYPLRITVLAPDSDQPLAVKEVQLPLDMGEQRHHIAFELPDAEMWSTHKPALYQVKIELSCQTGHVSQIEARFGLRNVEARGRWVYLNGQRIYLDGILYQPGNCTYEEIRRHVLAIKELGCNLIRVHISGIDPRIYDLADELGMLLWVEVPSPHRSNPRSRARHWAELQRMLVHIGLHPSVVLLSLYNESWGAEDIATNPETREYVGETFAYLRLNYSQFLVVGNDGWQNISNEGRLESCLLTAHIYKENLEQWRAALDRFASGENEGVTVLPLVIGDPFFYGGQAPLVVSEWGGFGFPMYGGPQDLEARTNSIHTFKQELAGRSIAGDVYTQATSIEEETNGLINPDTGELMVPARLLESNQSANKNELDTDQRG